MTYTARATQATQATQATGIVGVSLPFSKLQGAGNDFVIVDGRPNTPAARLGGAPAGAGAAAASAALSALARSMCDRHFGVGADGLLVASQPQAPGAVQRMRMFNPDGSEAEMCGNGLRCFARWLFERGEIGLGRALVETGAGVLAVDIPADGWIAAWMGRPALEPAAIPLSASGIGQAAAGPILRLPIELAGTPGETVDRIESVDGRLEVACVSMGNPHAVVFVSAQRSVIPLRVVEAIGPRLEHHPFFPAGTNVEVCQVVTKDRLRVAVWERGAGLTLACGTGACAAMVAARLRGYVTNRVAVELPGGELEVEWHGPAWSDDRNRTGVAAAKSAAGAAGWQDPAAELAGEVVLRGPTEHVFDGKWRVVG